MLEVIIYFVSWFIITTIWSILGDKNKHDVISRYTFTFIFILITMYIMVFLVRR